MTRNYAGLQSTNLSMSKENPIGSLYTDPSAVSNPWFYFLKQYITYFILINEISTTDFQPKINNKNINMRATEFDLNSLKTYKYTMMGYVNHDI